MADAGEQAMEAVEKLLGFIPIDQLLYMAPARTPLQEAFFLADDMFCQRFCTGKNQATEAPLQLYSASLIKRSMEWATQSVCDINEGRALLFIQ